MPMPRKYQIEIDSINTLEQALQIHYWEGHQELSKVAYASVMEQFQDASNIGHLAKAIVLLKQARVHLMDL